MARELEFCIHEDKKAGVITQILLLLDKELTALFGNIDYFLKSLPAESSNNETENGPYNHEELAKLIAKARLQLEKFDAGIEESVARMHSVVGCNPAMKLALDSIERHINNYDYERGLAELTAWEKSIQ